MNPRQIAPFAEQGHFTAVHNLIFRIVMPKVSSSAWKVLCFVISETVGYNRRSDTFSYSDIKEGTGIKSDTTISKSLTELLEGKPFGSPLILKKMGDVIGATSRDSSRYGLNRKFTVTLQKMKRESEEIDAPKNGASKKGHAPENGASHAPENGASKTAHIGSARNPTEKSNKQSNSLSPREAANFEEFPEGTETPISQSQRSDEGPFVEGANDSRFETPHFLAVIQACGLDPDLISWKRKANAAARSVQLAAKYSPQEIEEAGARWPLPLAPSPDQLLDSIQSLLSRKEPNAPQGKGGNDGPRNEHQKNAAERRELMRELGSRFGET